MVFGLLVPLPALLWPVDVLEGGEPWSSTHAVECSSTFQSESSEILLPDMTYRNSLRLVLARGNPFDAEDEHLEKSQ